MRGSIACLAAAVGMMTFVGVGCVQEKPAAPVTQEPTVLPPAPVDLNAVRAEYAKVDANAKVGVVKEVADDYALVTDINAEEWAQNAPVTFVDSAGNVITHGTVVLRPPATPSGVGVKFVPGARTPAEGDVAVRFSQP
ncbi:MAG: hypothetical protein QM770_20910 [Tepidisphaeraceae bacterium]